MGALKSLQEAAGTGVAEMVLRGRELNTEGCMHTCVGQGGKLCRYWGLCEGPGGPWVMLVAARGLLLPHL